MGKLRRIFGRASTMALRAIGCWTNDSFLLAEWPGTLRTRFAVQSTISEFEMDLSMKTQDAFSSAPVFVSHLQTACSGPELAAYVPDPELARELAQTLIADQ